MPEYSTSAAAPLAVIDDASKKQYLNSVCVTATGAWLVSVTTGENGGHHVYTRRSTDRGRTWEPRVVACDARLRGPEWDSEMGQLFPVPGGVGIRGARRIYQFHILRNTRSGSRFGRLVFTCSEDDGRSWRGPQGSGSVYNVATPSYALAPGADGWHLMAPGRLLSSGEWLLPMNVSTDPPALADIRSELVFALSRNILTEGDPQAVTFAFHPAPPHGVRLPFASDPAASLAQEPQVVELSDHRLLCVFRTGNGWLGCTTSRDYGRSWTRPRPLLTRPGGSQLPHPNAPCPMTRLSDGRVALLYCNNRGTAFGGSGPFDHLRNRQPVFVAVGVENGDEEQPLTFSEPRLLCSIAGFRPEVAWRDLTYGFLLEESGEYFHFYNAVWQAIQVNQVDPALLAAPSP